MSEDHFLGLHISDLVYLLDILLNHIKTNLLETYIYEIQFYSLHKHFARQFTNYIIYIRKFIYLNFNISLSANTHIITDDMKYSNFRILQTLKIRSE